MPFLTDDQLECVLLALIAPPLLDDDTRWGLVFNLAALRHGGSRQVGESRLVCGVPRPVQLDRLLNDREGDQHTKAP